MPGEITTHKYIISLYSAKLFEEEINQELGLYSDFKHIAVISVAPPEKLAVKLEGYCRPKAKQSREKRDCRVAALLAMTDEEKVSSLNNPRCAARGQMLAIGKLVLSKRKAGIRRIPATG